MKKLWVGLIVGFLAAASPAAAQLQTGAQDPLSLITSGMVLPYFSPAASLLELSSPVSGGQVHMFFYNETCVRTGDSAQVDLTANDVELLRVDTITAATSGLITAAGTVDGFTLTPTNFPPGVHARVLWVTPSGAVRTLEPIALSTVDNDRFFGPGTWSPLRTGATFYAPLADGNIFTTLYLVCPNTNIQGGPPTVPTNGGAFSPANFPNQVIFPPFRLAGQTTPLRVLVFDDEELLLRDTTSNCNCLTTRPVTQISSVYADAANAPDGTYSEVQGFGRVVVTPAQCSTTELESLINPPAPNPGNDCPLFPDPANATAQFKQLKEAGRESRSFSFTGYRAITVADIDIFGRLSNGCRGDISDDPSVCDPASTSTARTGGR